MKRFMNQTKKHGIGNMNSVLEDARLNSLVDIDLLDIPILQAKHFYVMCFNLKDDFNANIFYKYDIKDYTNNIIFFLMDGGDWCWYVAANGLIVEVLGDVGYHYLRLKAWGGLWLGCTLD
ncbi:hypothetical protein L1987_30246 [Smallanthus sonchifolius]|uniref:Uncharacterized protein n=1 Tax=Smallanthus sonchifolius TaxID=185202 RepID=A0ACB9I3P9_9ASTR|nr:hypothetical protein L1987_30246 [Smallanthus sonchifolius]